MMMHFPARRDAWYCRNQITKCCCSKKFIITLLFATCCYIFNTSNDLLVNLDNNEQDQEFDNLLPEDMTYVRQLSSHNDTAIMPVRIPHIVHQTWKDDHIPSQFHDMIRTWRKTQPNWRYWFWTDEDAKQFIKKRFPEYYEMFMNYKYDIHRADVVRYFILYEFGGIYADMDVEALRSLDVFTRYHYGFLALEPPIHADVMFRDFLASNALMGSAPHHPFFKHVIGGLGRWQSMYKTTNRLLAVTGPDMLTHMVQSYFNVIKDNRRRNAAFRSNTEIYLVDWNYFMPLPAEAAVKRSIGHCRWWPIRKNCFKHKKHNFYVGRAVPKYSYTVHRWTHVYKQASNSSNSKLIAELVEDVTHSRDVISGLRKV